LRSVNTELGKGAGGIENGELTEEIKVQSDPMGRDLTFQSARQYKREGKKKERERNSQRTHAPNVLAQEVMWDPLMGQSHLASVLIALLFFKRRAIIQIVISVTPSACGAQFWTLELCSHSKEDRSFTFLHAT
jgi:hypothetical protein